MPLSSVGKKAAASLAAGKRSITEQTRLASTITAPSHMPFGSSVAKTVAGATAAAAARTDSVQPMSSSSTARFKKQSLDRVFLPLNCLNFHNVKTTNNL